MILELTIIDGGKIYINSDFIESARREDIGQNNEKTIIVTAGGTFGVLEKPEVIFSKYCKPHEIKP